MQASFKAEPPARQSTMHAIFGFRIGRDGRRLQVSYEVPQPGVGSMMQYLITGTEGMIRLDSYGKVELRGKGDGWTVAFEQPAFDPDDVNDPIRLQAYADELRDVVVAIRDDREPLVQRALGRGHDVADRSRAEDPESAAGGDQPGGVRASAALRTATEPSALALALAKYSPRDCYHAPTADLAAIQYWTGLLGADSAAAATWAALIRA